VYVRPFRLSVWAVGRALPTHLGSRAPPHRPTGRGVGHPNQRLSDALSSAVTTDTPGFSPATYSEPEGASWPPPLQMTGLRDPFFDSLEPRGPFVEPRAPSAGLGGSRSPQDPPVRSHGPLFEGYLAGSQSSLVGSQGPFVGHQGLLDGPRGPPVGLQGSFVDPQGPGSPDEAPPVTLGSLAGLESRSGDLIHCIPPESTQAWSGSLAESEHRAAIASPSLSSEGGPTSPSPS